MSITNILSKYLQSSSVIYCNVLLMTKATIQELSSIRSEEKFNAIWNRIDILRKENDIDSPKLSRKKNIPAKIGV